MTNQKTGQALCDFQSGTVDILHFVLRNTDLNLIKKDIEARLSSMPNFFNEDAVLIDLRELDCPDEVDFHSLKKILQTMHIQCAGVVIDSAYHVWAKNNNLIVFESRKFSSKKKDIFENLRRISSKNSEAFQKIDKNESNIDTFEIKSTSDEKQEKFITGCDKNLPFTSTVIDKPLRSGQRIYAPGNLIILATVNPGSEIIAEGDIHIYAPLRGRALAGVRGNLEAKIFCTSLDAELVSIAGIYRTAENLIKNGFQKKAAKISLKAENLIFETLSIR